MLAFHLLVNSFCTCCLRRISRIPLPHSSLCTMINRSIYKLGHGILGYLLFWWALYTHHFLLGCTYINSETQEFLLFLTNLYHKFFHPPGWIQRHLPFMEAVKELSVDASISVLSLTELDHSRETKWPWVHMQFTGKLQDNFVIGW